MTARGTTARSGSFEAHYRSLIVGSVQRSLEAGTELHRVHGRSPRTRRGAGRARALGSPLVEAPPTAGGVGLAAPRSRRRRAAGAVWIVMIVGLVVVVRLGGIGSVWAGAADVALVAVTIAWFVFDANDAGERGQRRADRGAAPPRG